MNINAGNPSLQNILLHNMKEKKRPTFSAVFEKLNKHSGKLNTKSPLNSVLTNEQMFRYYVKDTMPQLDKSNDTFGESEEGSMMSSMMNKLGLNEPSFNSNNIQTLEGTTNNLPFQMGDGSATAQGEPFVPDGSNNAFTGNKKSVLSLSEAEVKYLNLMYGSGASSFINLMFKYYNDSPDYDEVFESTPLNEIMKDLDFIKSRNSILNSNYSNNAPVDKAQEDFFDAILGEGAIKRIRELVKIQPTLYKGMSYENIIKEPLFKSKSGNQKTMSISDLDNGLDSYINNILQETQNDLFNQNETEDDFLQEIEVDEDEELTSNMYSREEEDFIRRVLDDTFDEPGVAQSKELTFDSDFLELYFADNEEKNKMIVKMTSQQKKEYDMLETEYRKEDYEIRIRDLQKFGGSGLRNNRFQVQLEPIQELDGSYSDEFLRLYYAPSDERYNIESKMSVFGSGKGSLEYHKKMVIAYQKEPEEYRRQTENFIKKKNIEQPPPEQSITVRRRGRPLGVKNKPKISVDIPPKPKNLGDVILGSMMKNMGAATKPPMGAAKGPKSPLSKRIKDL
jgi:hypothetical protein